jgi:hypothetical protein
VPKAEIVANNYDLSLNRYKEVVHETVDHDSPKKILTRLAKLEDEIAKGKKRTGGVVEMKNYLFRPNGPTSLSPGQRPGSATPTHPWPKGPKSLSPGQRPGTGTSTDSRPEGPRSVLAWFGVQPYRAPLARGIRTDMIPGRCPGLRNDAPVART